MDCGHLRVGMLVTLYVQFDVSYYGTIDYLWSDCLVLVSQSFDGVQLYFINISEIIVHV